MMIKCILFALVVAVANAGCGCVNTGADFEGIPTNFCLDSDDTCDDLNIFSEPNADGSDRFQCLCQSCTDTASGSVCEGVDVIPRCTCRDDLGNINTGVTPQFCFPFNTLTECPPDPRDTCCCLPAGAEPTANCLAGVERSVCEAEGIGDTCEPYCCCENSADLPGEGACIDSRVALCTLNGLGRCRATPAPTGAPTTEAPTTEAPTTEAPTTEAPTTEAPTTEAPTPAPTTDAPTAAPTAAPTTPAPTEDPPCCCLGAGETDPLLCTPGTLTSVCIKGGACIAPVEEDTCCCDINLNGVCVTGYLQSACIASGFACIVSPSPTAAPTPNPTNAPTTAAPTNAPTNGPPCCCFPFGSQVGEPCVTAFSNQCVSGGGVCDVERCCCETTDGAEDPVCGFPVAQCLASGHQCEVTGGTQAPTPQPATPAPTPERCCCYTHGQTFDDQCRIMDKATCAKAGGLGCQVDRCCCVTATDDETIPCAPNQPRANCNADGFFCEDELCACTINGEVNRIPISLCEKGRGVCDAVAPVEQDLCDCIPFDGSPLQLDVPVAVCEKGDGVCDVCDCRPFTNADVMTGVPRRVCEDGDGTCVPTAPVEMCECLPFDGSAIQTTPRTVCEDGDGVCQDTVTAAPTDAPIAPVECTIGVCTYTDGTPPLEGVPQTACIKGTWVCTTASPTPAPTVCTIGTCTYTDGTPPLTGVPQTACIKGLWTCEECTIGTCTYADGTPPLTGVPETACVKGMWSCDTAAPTPAPTVCTLGTCTYTDGTPPLRGVPQTACIKGMWSCEECTIGTCVYADGTPPLTGIPETACVKGVWTCDTAAPTPAPTPCIGVCRYPDGTPPLFNVPPTACVKGVWTCEAPNETPSPTMPPSSAAPTTAAPTPEGATPAPTSAAPTASPMPTASAAPTTPAPTVDKPVPTFNVKPNDAPCTSSEECISGCCRFSVDTASLICREGGGLRLCV